MRYIPIGTIGTSNINHFYRRSFAFDKFKAPAEWLEKNSQAGDIVFHSDWDEFPILFYHNHHNYYLVGLDPTFMYEYDSDLHRIWVDIVTGQSTDQLYSKIKTLFNARYVFIDTKQNEVFANNLANDFGFQEVFSNEEAKIYRLIE